MKSLYIALGYACNHRCIFCPCSSTTPRNMKMSVQEVIDSIATSITNKDVHSVLLSGGEPTIQQNFWDILEYLSKTDLSVGILSNADRLENRKIVDRILSLIPPQRLNITTSLHSHNSKKHDKVTQSVGSFNRSLNGVNNLIDAGVNTTIKHCITKLNYREMEDFTDFIYNSFIDWVNLLFCSIDYCGIAGENESVVAVRFTECGPYIERALDKVIQYKENGRLRNTIVTDTPLCAVDPYYWYFFSYHSKERIPAYNSPISGGNMSKLLFDVESDCGTFFNSCKTCIVEQICPGAWRTACELFGEDAVSPIWS